MTTGSSMAAASADVLASAASGRGVRPEGDTTAAAAKLSAVAAASAADGLELAATLAAVALATAAAVRAGEGITAWGVLSRLHFEQSPEPEA